MDTVIAYRGVRLRYTELLRSLPESAASTVVPACPRWTVQQLTSHAVGVSADILAGNIVGAGTDEWTDAQVQARRGRTLAELADEWDGTGPQVEAALAGGLLPAQAVFDQVTHEHDLRGAIDKPGAQDTEELRIGLSFVVENWPKAMAAAGLPAVRIVAGTDELVVGEDPSTTLRLTPFEALRAFTGRRSLGQVASYDWGTDPSPWLAGFTWGPFTPTPVDLVC